MTSNETNIARMLRQGVVDGWLFSYFADQQRIRAYSKYGATIMTIELADHSEEAEAEYFDILTPVLT